MAWTLVSATMTWGAAAAAQEAPEDPPSTAVLETQADAADRGLSGAVERVLRAELDDLEVVDVAGTPALDLEDLQLAVGCVGETADCLTAVTEQLEVEALVLSTVDRAGDAKVLTVTFFDARRGERDSVVRRVEGRGADNRLLEGIDAQLRELFGLPAPAEPEGAAPLDPPGAEADEVDGEGLPALPFVLAGVGVAALAAGGTLGVLGNANGDDYAALEVRNSVDAEEASDLYTKADRQAKAAYGLFAAGGALVVSGVVLFFVMRGPDDEEEPPSDVTVVPSLGPTGGGLSVAGRFGGENR